MSNANKPISAIVDKNGIIKNTNGWHESNLDFKGSSLGGLSKIEHFAGLAMQGLLANHGNSHDQVEVASVAVSFAKALLNQLEVEE